MLNDSILNNVAFLESEIDETRVRQCISQVNLDSWVLGLKNGLNTSVGELGNKVSGGQKQRIAIARALYKDAGILIFDEVTNNLDTESKNQMLKAIAELKKQNKTVLFITHKEDELSLCDKVYLLKNSKLETRKI